MFEFDFEELWKDENYGILIAGAPGSGKTNLAFLLADSLIRNNVIVYVFDPTPNQIWKKSTIPKYESFEGKSHLILRNESRAYDVSYLTPTRQQKFVENFCRILFIKRRGERVNRPKTFLVFEEAQNYLPSQPRPSGISNEQVRQIIHIGRNVDLRFALLTQYTSDLDEKELKCCRLRFFGSCEDDEVEKLKPLIKDNITLFETLREMRKRGQYGFVYYRHGACKIVKPKLFEKT